jgi:FixJ family two-component response regulator
MIRRTSKHPLVSHTRGEKVKEVELVQRPIEELARAGAIDAASPEVTAERIEHGVHLALTAPTRATRREDKRWARAAARLEGLKARERDLQAEIGKVERHLVALEMDLAVRDGATFPEGADRR